MSPAPLTMREMSVSVLLAQGYRDKEIAAKLEISVQRVAQVVEAVRDKMGLSKERDARLQIARAVQQPDLERFKIVQAHG